MKISVLTTITNPEQRQDKWKEALECYSDLADEIVLVNGGSPLSVGYLFQHPKIKILDLEWPNEWNWVELPKHLSAGRKECTGDWIIKMDIDQFFHENDIKDIKDKLSVAPEECQVMTFQKMSLTYGKKYYQKGGQPIAFRNSPEISIGKNLDKETDLCFPIRQTGTETIFDWEGKIDSYELPVGRDLVTGKTGIKYWNCDYFFKTKEFTKKEFWRFSRAYERYFKTWKFGSSEDSSFHIFIDMLKARYKDAPYTYKLEDLPKYIRKSAEELTPEQFGYNGWGLI